MHQFKFIVPGHIISDTVRDTLKDAQKACDRVYPHGKMCQFGRPWVKNLETGAVVATRIKGKWLGGDKRTLADTVETAKAERASCDTLPACMPWTPVYFTR